MYQHSAVNAEISLACNQIEEAAGRIREACAPGFDPPPDLIDALETSGIRVFMAEAQSPSDSENKFDHRAARVSDLPIVVAGVRAGPPKLESRLAEDLDKKRVICGSAADPVCVVP